MAQRDSRQRITLPSSSGPREKVRANRAKQMDSQMRLLPDALSPTSAIKLWVGISSRSGRAHLRTFSNLDALDDHGHSAAGLAIEGAIKPAEDQSLPRDPVRLNLRHRSQHAICPVGIRPYAYILAPSH